MNVPDSKQNNTSMKSDLITGISVLILLLVLNSCTGNTPGEVSGGGASDTGELFFRSAEIFAPIELPTHGGTITELPNGDLMAAWFEGTGERWADDVVIRGARFSGTTQEWSEPFELADVPGYPDINPVLFVDPEERLWLVWYTVIANQWETSLPRYLISTDYLNEGAPVWEWQDVLLVKPGDNTERGRQAGDRFVEAVKNKVVEYRDYLQDVGALVSGDETVSGSLEWFDARAREMIYRAEGKHLVRDGRIYNENGSYESTVLGYPLMRRIGWQTYNKSVFMVIEIIILYHYSVVIMNYILSHTVI